MVPILIVQIILFPYVASVVMGNWTDSRRTLALQETASTMGSSIQQLYSSLNHTTVKAGNVNYTLSLPVSLEGYSYTANGSLRSVSDTGDSASKILEITLSIQGLKVSTTTTVTLGESAEWVAGSIYYSNSTHSGISAQKFANDTIKLSLIS
ncbi:MAG: hypothetical protein ACFCUE_05710 [Candidatus Bathyarchaeia archaeon]